MTHAEIVAHLYQEHGEHPAMDFGPYTADELITWHWDKHFKGREHVGPYEDPRPIEVFTDDVTECPYLLCDESGKVRATTPRCVYCQEDIPA
jgi:hypothetical protein